MTTALRQWWGHLRSLIVGTLQLWWRCLPVLIVGLVLGRLAHDGLLLVAALISAEHAWLAVGLLAVGFAALLVGYLFCLRALGRQLAVGAALTSTNLGENLVDEPLTRLVAMTLLPFLGIYAVFGEVQQTSGQLVTYEAITRGVLSEGVLNTLNPRTGRQMLIILAVLAATYVVRRSLDFALERTGHRIFGFLTALAEAFFMLVLIYGGTRTINRGKNWLADRRVSTWWNDFWAQVADLLRNLPLDLPGWWRAGWHLLTGPGWEFFSAGLGQPVLWLAVAAMAFGSRVMSAAELWRETVGERPTPRRLPLDALGNSGLQKVWVEAKELFFGDIDDKYLPTLQSLRLVLSAGASLIGAFCLVHMLTRVPGWLVGEGLRAIVGPARSNVWVALGTGQDLLEMLASEPLRLSLLAVTFARCLQLLAHSAREEQPA